MIDPAQERTIVLAQLESAVSLMDESLSPLLVPNDGLGIAFAIRNARDRDGIAAMTWTTGPDGRVRSEGKPAFGANEHLSRILLTAMKFDPALRAAAVLRFTPGALEAFDDMFLETCSFDPARGPAGIGSMDWGVASCCKNGVPDAVYDKGTAGKEGLIRLFGEKPGDIASNIIICSNRI